MNILDIIMWIIIIVAGIKYIASIILLGITLYTIIQERNWGSEFLVIGGIMFFITVLYFGSVYIYFHIGQPLISNSFSTWADLSIFQQSLFVLSILTLISFIINNSKTGI